LEVLLHRLGTTRQEKHDTNVQQVGHELDLDVSLPKQSPNSQLKVFAVKQLSASLGYPQKDQRDHVAVVVITNDEKFKAAIMFCLFVRI
jgi:hypothetical protein